MNKKTIPYIVAVFIVILVVGFIIWKIGQRTEQPILPELEYEQVLDETTQPIFPEDEQFLNEIEFEGLDTEFQEVDGLINQL